MMKFQLEFTKYFGIFISFVLYVIDTEKIYSLKAKSIIAINETAVSMDVLAATASHKNYFHEYNSDPKNV